MIKVLFTVELSSNVNIRSKLVTQILRLLPGQFWHGQEGVDPLLILPAPQVLHGNLGLSDKGGGEVPDGGAVDKVPLLCVHLPAAGLLSQLLLRHGPMVSEGWTQDSVLLPYLLHMLISAMVPMNGFPSK